MARLRKLYERVLEGWRNASLWNCVLSAAFLIPVTVVLAGLFSPFGVSVFDDAGSAADWLAAIGTWVIGLGAMRFAASDHEMKIADRRQVRIDALAADVEEVERVARNSRYAADELRGALAALQEAFDAIHMLGRKPRAAQAHVQRAANFLTWLPTQLRLLSVTGTAEAEEADMGGQKLVGLSGRIEEAPDIETFLKLIGRMRAEITALLPKLEALAVTAGQDAERIGTQLYELQRQADEELAAKR